MAFKFEKIMQAVCRQLEQIIMEEDDEDRGFITAKDFMNDFATEDFISKNIRVRPTSGVTRGGDNDETKTQGGDQGLSRMGGAEGNLDDEEKFNETVKYELEAERKAAKEKMKEFQKRRALEEELLKKKKGGY